MIHKILLILGIVVCLGGAADFIYNLKNGAGVTVRPLMSFFIGVMLLAQSRRTKP